MTKTMNLITVKADLDKEIKLIGMSTSKMDMRIHRAAASCVAHIKEHGDNTLLLSLFKILPDSYRRNSFLTWCEDLAGVEVITKDGNGKSLKKSEYIFKKRIPVSNEMMASAIATPPMTYKKGSEGTPFVSFDLRSELLKLVHRATAAQKKAAEGKANKEDIIIDDDVFMFIKNYTSAGIVSKADPIITQ